MNLFHIYLFLCANFVAAKVSYYKKCYEQLSICLITRIDDDPSTSADNSKLTRSSANRWCNANSSKLAIIPDGMVDSAMNEFINDDSANLDSDVITNGYRFKENNWTWINGRPSAIYPSSSYDAYPYAYLAVSQDRRTYYLAGSHSTSNRKFICSYFNHSTVSDSTCSNGYQRQIGTCYKIHTEEVTWFAARNICLKQGLDLAIFQDGAPSLVFERSESYWIGQRKESWYWWNGQEYVDVKYSNWDYGYPLSSEGDCLCLKATTDSKWKNCDCSQKYRYVCIQEVTTTANTTSSSGSITTHSPPSIDHSTSAQILGNTFSYETSGNSSVMQETDKLDIQRMIIWIPLALLFAVLTVIVSRFAVLKLRKRSTRQEVSHTANTFQPTSSVDDYTTLKREYLTENVTYAELNAYETIEDEKQTNYN